MSVTALPLARPAFPAIRALLATRWLWCLAAVVFIGIRDWAGDPKALGLSLGDTDDATRLTQVREWMAGTSWFDMTLPRLGGATPLVSHWSRLIDLPLALILSVAGLFVAPDAAELTARVVWPSILLFLFFRVLTREAELRAGEMGAIMMLVFGATCISGLAQFSIGRIDHHNAMILGAVGGLIALARAFEAPREGWYAGAMLGFALAIGYEPLAIIIPGIAAATLLAVVIPQWLEGVRNAVTALAVTMTIAVALTIAPGRR
jgi:hypothetical protein